MTGTETSISFDTACTWIKAWRAKNDIPGDNFIASWIPMADAQRIIAETNATDLRAYNGYDEVNKLYKLILVGVDANGNDIISIEDPSSPINSQIYDLTMPCPNTCDNSSPLFKKTFLKSIV